MDQLTDMFGSLGEVPLSDALLGSVSGWSTRSLQCLWNPMTRRGDAEAEAGTVVRLQTRSTQELSRRSFKHARSGAPKDHFWRRVCNDCRERCRAHLQSDGFVRAGDGRCHRMMSPR